MIVCNMGITISKIMMVENNVVSEGHIFLSQGWKISVMEVSRIPSDCRLNSGG